MFDTAASHGVQAARQKPARAIDLGFEFFALVAHDLPFWHTAEIGRSCTFSRQRFSFGRDCCTVCAILTNILGRNLFPVTREKQAIGGGNMTAGNIEKFDEYVKVANRFLEVARRATSRSVRMRKRAQAAEWLKLAKAIPDNRPAT